MFCGHFVYHVIFLTFHFLINLVVFLFFCRLVVDSVSDMIDYWIPFNEPHVFCMLTYCAGAWPGGHPDMLEAATSALPTGVFMQAMHWMAIAHLKAYDYIHEKRSMLHISLFKRGNA